MPNIEVSPPQKFIDGYCWRQPIESKEDAINFVNQLRLMWNVAYDEYIRTSTVGIPVEIRRLIFAKAIVAARFPDAEKLLFQYEPTPMPVLNGGFITKEEFETIHKALVEQLRTVRTEDAATGQIQGTSIDDLIQHAANLYDDTIARRLSSQPTPSVSLTS